MTPENYNSKRYLPNISNLIDATGVSSLNIEKTLDLIKIHKRVKL